MKPLLRFSALTLLLGSALAASLANSQAANTAASTPKPLEWTNPLVPQRADPQVSLQADGNYYLAATVPKYDYLELRRASTISGLSTAEPKIVWHRHAAGPMSGYIWAPELHRINNKWYIYFAGGQAPSGWNIHMYVLENAAQDPFTDSWVEKGEIKMNWESFTLDATTFESRGTRYLVWAQSPRNKGGTDIYIAKMDTPWSISGTQVMISHPEFPWELRGGVRVNEGPSALVKSNRIFITYSASATDANYCLGMVTASADSDLLDPKSWSKSTEPVLKTNPATSQYGPGHNSFTTSPDGKTDILVYHTRNYEKIKGNPLDNCDRATRAQVIHWKPDGTPDFGVPVADGPYDGTK